VRHAVEGVHDVGFGLDATWKRNPSYVAQALHIDSRGFEPVGVERHDLPRLKGAVIRAREDPADPFGEALVQACEDLVFPGDQLGKCGVYG